MKTNNTVKGVGVNQLGTAAPFELKGILESLQEYLMGLGTTELDEAALTLGALQPQMIAQVSWPGVETAVSSWDLWMGSISEEAGQELVKAVNDGLYVIPVPVAGAGRSTVYGAVAIPTGRTEGIVVVIGKDSGTTLDALRYGIIAYKVTVVGRSARLDWCGTDGGSGQLSLSEWSLYVSAIAQAVGDIYQD